MMLPGSDTASVLEIVGALLCLAGIGYSLWSVTDDLVDRRNVRRWGEIGGPRWISNTGHLIADSALAVGWLWFLRLHLIAAYLPPRLDLVPVEIHGWQLGDEAAVGRLLFAIAVLVAQGAWRVTRWRLRRLPEGAWDSLFGESQLWQIRFEGAQAQLRRAEEAIAALTGEIARRRAERHEALNLATRRDLEVQLIRRWAGRHGIEIPPNQALASQQEATP